MMTLHIMSFVAGILGIYLGVKTITRRNIRLGFGLPPIVSIVFDSKSAIVFGIVLLVSGILFLLPLIFSPFVGAEVSARLIPIVSAIAIVSLAMAFIIGVFLNFLSAIEEKSTKEKHGVNATEF